MNFTARRPPNRLHDNSGSIRWKRNALLAGASVLVLASPALTMPASAQSYTNYDGSKTNDLNAALATWTSNPEFKYKTVNPTRAPLQGDWGLAAMNAQYAYVLGFSGVGVKLGSVDSGLLLSHEEFATRGNVTAITISGTYLNDGSQNDGGRLTWKAGDAFSTPGSWNGVADLANHIGKNDNHGSHVSGTIAAAKNGLDANGAGMMGVAFGSQYYITNSNGTDSSIYGSNMDYNYFKEAYGQLAAAGVRVINSSWGSPNSADNVNTVGSMAAAYASLESLNAAGVSTKKSWLDAAADVSLQTGVIQVFAAGNIGQKNPNIRASAPYFRPEIEQDWIAAAALSQNLALASFSNRCGVAKYWCVSSPGVNTNSLQTTSNTAYASESGTSMAAPHVTGALGLLMERYPSLDNQAIRTILFTTAQHLGSGPADLPNADFGWGIPDLQKGMNGPGQLLGAFNANIAAGISDTWSNSISEAALSQRKAEETAEIQAWATSKAQLQATLQSVPATVDPTPALIAQMPTAKALLQAVIAANTTATYTPAGLNAAVAAANADPGGAALLALYTKANPNWRNGYSQSTDFAAFINGRSDTQLAGAIANTPRDAVIAANAAINNQIVLTQGRIDQLTQKTDKDYVGSFVKTGSGALTLTGTNTYSGLTSVIAGVLEIGTGGSIAGSADVSGGVLTGGGTIGGSVAVGNGAVFAPGNGTAGSMMSVGGNLALQSGAIYAVFINTGTSSFASVKGTAVLGGSTVSATYATGSYVEKRYNLLNAAGGVSGTFASSVINTNLPSGFSPTLSYDANNAYLDLMLSYSGLNANQAAVANALTRSFNAAGGIPMAFGALSPAGLTAASGELATGTQQVTFNAMNQFMGLMSDVSAAGRGDPGASAGPTGYADEQALSYAAKRKPNEALAAIYTKAPPPVPAQPYRGWSVWAAGFGGSESISGNAAAGTTSSTSSLAGTAVGADYRFSPDTVAGFAMAGGATSFNMTGQGSGNSDLFQVGGFVRHSAGAAYISAALAYGWQDVTINRGADRRRTEFIANTVSGRIEGGYRYVMSGMGVTPYAAAQFTTVSLPGYLEPVLNGADLFALSYAGKTVTDPRSELGVRTDKSWAVQDAILTLRGRLAWAHDYNTDRSLAVTFQSLPASSFVIDGARPAADSALVTASAEWKWISGISLGATFDGEFSNTTSAYTGKGVVRYQW